MSFAVPLAAALGLAVALPILAHLSRQLPTNRRAFGAMLLVRRLSRRLRRRRRLKDALLFALRALALLALAAAATGPEIRFQGGSPTFGGTGRVIVVLDRSLSMTLTDGGSTLFARAQADVAKVLGDLPPGTQVGAVAFGNGAERLTPTLTTDVGSVAARLAVLEPTGGRSNLQAALFEARSLLAGEPGEVLLFSDEAGPTMVRAAESEIALLVEQGSAVLPRPVRADPPRNVAVVSAEYADGIEGGQVLVEVQSFGPQPVEVSCEVVLPDGATIPIFVEIPAEDVVVERITVPREASGGVGRVRCADPDLPFDDSRYFHLPRVGASRVLIVDGEPGDTPTRSEVYFLERALAPWGGARGGVRPEVVTAAGVGSLDPETFRVVFLANVTDPRPFSAELVAFVRAGGNLVITGGENVTEERYDPTLGSILPASIRRPRSLTGVEEGGVPLELPDVGLELFSSFARTGRALFPRMRAHRVLTLDAYDDGGDVATLLRWEGGLPALVERKVGAGRVLVFTGSADLAWGNVPIQAGFVPFVQRLTTWLGADAGAAAARFDAVLGEEAVVALPDLAVEPEVRGPDGALVSSTTTSSAVVFRPTAAGAYSVALPGAPPLAWVAVNVAPDESDVRVRETVNEVEADIDPSLFTRRRDLSPWLLWLGVALVVAQTGLAVRRGPDEPT
jgi:hypothetical protein